MAIHTEQPAIQPKAAEQKPDAKPAKDPNAPVALCPTCGQAMPDKPKNFEEYPKMMYKEEPPAPKKPKAPEPEPEPEPKIDTKIAHSKEEEDKIKGEGFSDKVPEPKKDVPHGTAQPASSQQEHKK